MKFDFTDELQCKPCTPKLLATDHDDDKAEEGDEEPELKSRDEKSIKKYQDLILHPPKAKKKKCSFYLDRYSLRQYSNVYGVKTTKDEATFNEKVANLQRKGGLECHIEEADDGSKKATVKVDQSYTFSKMVKPDLEEIVESWTDGAKLTDRKFTNNICLIIKIMMNKANMNPGIEWKRVDWQNTSDKLWTFKK